MVDEWFMGGIITHPRKVTLFIGPTGECDYMVYIWNQCRPSSDAEGCINRAYLPVTGETFEGHIAEAYLAAIDAAQRWVEQHSGRIYPPNTMFQTDGYQLGTESYKQDCGRVSISKNGMAEAMDSWEFFGE